jgi:hypothetical protein
MLVRVDPLKRKGTEDGKNSICPCQESKPSFEPVGNCFTRPKPLDFSGTVKIRSMSSFGGEVKYVSHVPALRHVKDPSNCSKSRVAS